MGLQKGGGDPQQLLPACNNPRRRKSPLGPAAHNLTSRRPYGMLSPTMADDIETQLRKDLMTIQIERLRQEIRMENRKFFIQAVLAIAASLGAGIAIGHFLLHG